MSKHVQHAISPSRSENYPDWYQAVIKSADLAESSPVRGCMVIKPWGYGIWERMQAALDRKIKETGHENAYFPLLIPLSFMEKEAEHVQGFAKECAVVTHHRLEVDAKGGLKPAGELEEPYIIRPTSETIIGHMYAKWIQSYRDLPLLINQWANVMRWEMRTRLFLRTSEFLWQEGHTVHATAEEAVAETLRMLSVYEEFMNTWLALPVITGMKTPSERFPGAEDTYTLEAMMQDGKALQAGTSHFLGQNFSRAQEIKFLDQAGQSQYGWTTSWGTTTRLIGAVVMSHGDDDGLVLPPRIAPKQLVILPIYKNADERVRVLAYCDKLTKALQQQQYEGESLRIHIDDRDLRGGEKAWQHVKKGVPLRLEVGLREVERETVFMGRRDVPPKEKTTLGFQEFVTKASAILGSIHTSLWQRALTFRQQHTVAIDSLDDFVAFFEGESQQDGPANGFALCHWHDEASEHPLLQKLKVTPRCIPLGPVEGHAVKVKGRCLFTGKESLQKIILAKSY